MKKVGQGGRVKSSRTPANLASQAIQLCTVVPDFRNVKPAVAGVVFFGTPHTDSDLDALLNALRATSVALATKGSPVHSDELREYVNVVSRANKAFNNLQPRALHMHSYWETQPSETKSQETSLGVPVRIPRTLSQLLLILMS